MAGNHQSAASTDEGADQSIQRDVAAGRKAGRLGRRGARHAGGVAGRKDNDIGVDLEVEDFAERQKPVRSGTAETGQQGRLGGAFRGAGGNHAVGREMQNPVIAEVAALLDCGVGELIAGDDFDAGWIVLPQNPARGFEFLGRNRLRPG